MEESQAGEQLPGARSLITGSAERIPAGACSFKPLTAVVMAPSSQDLEPPGKPGRLSTFIPIHAANRDKCTPQAADESVRRDVLLFNPALWKCDLSGVNQLREAAMTDIGDCAAMHQTMVTLRPAEELARQ